MTGIPTTRPKGLDPGGRYASPGSTPVRSYPWDRDVRVLQDRLPARCPDLWSACSWPVLELRQTPSFFDFDGPSW